LDSIHLFSVLGVVAGQHPSCEPPLPASVDNDFSNYIATDRIVICFSQRRFHIRKTPRCAVESMCGGRRVQQRKDCILDGWNARPLVTARLPEEQFFRTSLSEIPPIPE